MKAKLLVSMSIIFLSANSVVFADRLLGREKVLQIFEHLTSQPRRTWIPAGTIEATREEYRAPEATDPNEINRQISQRIQEYQSNPNKRELTKDLQKMRLDAIPFNVRHELTNEYTMSSTVLVRFDGDRFYWEIIVNSRTDSVKPGKDLAGNFMTMQFDIDWNARRIFAWDGEKYITYALPGNHAIVDTTGDIPHNVKGPLTAGIIPWGYGRYAYEDLSKADFSAVERDVDGQTQVRITLTNSGGSKMLFVLDPVKDYAVISCSMSGLGNTIISNYYDGYQLVSGNWVPTTILLERYEAGSNMLLARDLWNITHIDTNVPAGYEFDVGYEDDALIEHFSFVSDKSQMYRYSQTANTDLLLAERLGYVAAEGLQSQNCATVSFKYVTSQFGKDVTDQQLAQLVSEPDKSTSLYEMKQFAQGLGLYCRAVKTDIETLRNLNSCAAILHIPSKKHFVVLESIDDKYVWIIDLASSKFFYRTNLDFFGMDWTEGVALLVSDQPIQMQGNITGIGDVESHNIIGASGYSCTALLQTYNVIYCGYAFGLCGGKYQVFFTRYGCEAAEEGDCRGSWMLRYMESPCIEHPYDPLACTVTGEWTFYYMRACA